MEQKPPFIKGRKPAVDPKTMYKVLTYAYLNGIYTTDKIETAYIEKIINYTQIYTLRCTKFNKLLRYIK
jgi:transposase